MLRTHNSDHQENTELEQQVFENVVSKAKHIGFDYCTYIVQMPLPISRPMILTFNNYSLNKRKANRRGIFGGIDPQIAQGLVDMKPFEWEAEILNRECVLSEAVRHKGVNRGWAHASRAANGAIGVLFLGCSADQSKNRGTDATVVNITSMAQIVHGHMADILIRKHVPEVSVVLTSREREVLCWAADGSTSNEVSRILGISEATVVFHLKKVIKKLGASNKMQAVAKAIVLGILS